MNISTQSAQVSRTTSIAKSTTHPAVSTSRISPTPQFLHHEFVRLGSMRLKLKNKMLAILPEIYGSGIWKKYAGTIEGYAGKFGDIAGTTVRKRLRLEENLDDKPFLKAAIATVGVHKVAMVAKITSPENDKVMAEKLSNMSKSAVQSLSKELRVSQSRGGQNGDSEGRVSEMQLSFDDGDFSGQRVGGSDFADRDAINPSSPCHAIPITKKIELDENSTFLFLKLKKKLSKNLSDKEFLKLIIEEREKQEFSTFNGRKAHKQEEITGKIVLQKTVIDGKSSGKFSSHKTQSVKSVTGESFSERTSRISDRKISAITDKVQILTSRHESRYITAAKRRQTLQPTNGKCSYPNCNLPYAVFHHTDRYSESKSHDSIIPLCKVHHEFVHNNLIQDEKRDTDNWKLAVSQKTNVKASLADNLYKKYRSEALRK